MVVDQVIDKVVEKEVNTVDSKVQIRKESDQTRHKTKKLKDGSVSNHDWVYSLSKMTNIALDNSCYLGLQLYLSRGWRTQVQSSAPPQTPP